MIDKIAERELNLGEILKAAWEIYILRIKPIAAITLVVFIPANIIRYLVYVNADRLSTYVYGLNIFLDFLLLIIALMGVAVIVENSVARSGDPGWRPALIEAVGRWDSCVIANLFAGLIILGLTFFLIIPGIVFAIYYFFVTQAVILRGKKGKAALDYSMALVKGRWWKVFYLSILILFLSLVKAAVVQALPAGISPLVNTLTDVLFAYTNVAVTIMFINLDHRRDGNGHQTDGI